MHRNIEVAQMPYDLRGQPLTMKESAVCEMLSVGMTSKEIARQMNKSHHTIHMYRKSVLRKLGAKNLGDAVRMWIEKKLKEGQRS